MAAKEYMLQSRVRKLLLSSRWLQRQLAPLCPATGRVVGGPPKATAHEARGIKDMTTFVRQFESVESVG